MKVALKQDDDLGYQVLSILKGTHNHESSVDVTAYPIYRTTALDPEAIVQIKSLSAAGIIPAQILVTIRQQFLRANLVQKDVSNILQKVRLEQLSRRSLIQQLLKVYLF